MRAVLPFLLAAAVSGCTAAPPQAQAPPFKAAADTLQLMDWVLDPAAGVIWDSVGTVIDASGEHNFRPETDDEWTAVRNAAAVVAESGNLLMMDPRARDRGDDWMQYSEGLVDAGILAIKAAESRDPDAVFDAGGRIYAVCASCHRMYLEESLEAAVPR